MKSNPSSTGIDRRVLLSGLAVLPTLQVNLRNRPTLSRLSTNLHDRGCSFRISKEPCTEDDNRNEGAFPQRLVAVAAISVAAALAEHYLLEEFAPAKTRFTYRVAIEPRPRGRRGRSALANVLRINVQERVREPAELRPESPDLAR
jgi:hypothetical protein